MHDVTSSTLLIEERFAIIREYIEEYSWSPVEMTVLTSFATISKSQDHPDQISSSETKPDPVEGINKLFQLLSITDVLEETKDVKLLEEVTSFMNFFYDEKYFTSLWLYIFESKEYLSNSTIFVDRIRLLVYGTKIFANFYLKFGKIGEWQQIPYKISYEGFLYHLFNSIILACYDYSKAKSTNLPPQISSIFEFFDLTQLKKFFFFLFYLIQFQEEEDENDISSLKKVGRILSKDEVNSVLQELIRTMTLPALLLDCIEIGFQLYFKSKSLILPSFTSDLAENLIISSIRQYVQLIEHNDTRSFSSSVTYDMEEFQLLIKRIFLKQLIPNSLANKLFGSTPLIFNRMQQLVITSSLVDIWGQAFFHNNGNLALFQSYSNQLLILFENFTQKDLTIPIYLSNHSMNNDRDPERGSNLSIEILLINSISTGLECSLPFIRMYTMKVATKYAKILQLPLQFEELEGLEKEFVDEDLINPKLRPDPSIKNTILNSKPSNDSSHVGATNEEEDEDEDEIQGYFLSHENDSILHDIHDNKPKVFYLRNCIDLITAPEGTPEIRQGILMALEAIPKIVSNHPYDGPSLSGELLFHVLNLQNQYNIENFDGLKAQSIICLLTEYPIRTIPTIGQAILNDDVSLGIRRDSLRYLRETALLIYQRNDPSKQKNNPEEEAMNNHQQNSNGKTVIKRPKKYQQWKQKKRRQQQGGTDTSSRNQFQELLDLFFLPTMKLLQTFLHKHSVSKEMPVPSSSSLLSLQVDKEEKFNLISEVLISPSKPSPDSHRDKSPAFKKALIQEIGEISQLDSSSSLSTIVHQESPGKKDQPNPDKKKELDETDFMLPYDALLSVALFLKCSVFHLKYRVYALAAIQIAIEYFRICTSSLTMRRGSLCLLCTAIEGFLQTFSPISSNGSTRNLENARPKGPLDALLNITTYDQQMMATMSGDGGMTMANPNEVKMELLTETPLLSFIETILIQAEKEQDVLCQQLTLSLISNFQDQLGSH